MKLRLAPSEVRELDKALSDLQSNGYTVTYSAASVPLGEGTYIEATVIRAWPNPEKERQLGIREAIGKRLAITMVIATPWPVALLIQQLSNRQRNTAPVPVGAIETPTCDVSK